MKALLLAATSSLALTGFAMAQTTPPADSAPTTTEAPAAGATSTDTSTPTTDAATSAETGSDVDVVDSPTDTLDTTATDAPAGDMATTPAPTDAPAGDMATMPADGAEAPAGDAAEAPVVAPDVGAPVLSADNPGMTASTIIGTRIFTTNQPSTTEFAPTEMTERPADWTDIAKIDDIVFNAEGDVVGYLADIGGFLGIGAKKVLLGVDALHITRIGEDVFYATNFTQDELRALPDFDSATVAK